MLSFLFNLVSDMHDKHFILKSCACKNMNIIHSKNWTDFVCFCGERDMTFGEGTK